MRVQLELHYRYPDCSDDQNSPSNLGLGDSRTVSTCVRAYLVQEATETGPAPIVVVAESNHRTDAALRPGLYAPAEITNHPVISDLRAVVIAERSNEAQAVALCKAAGFANVDVAGDWG